MDFATNSVLGRRPVLLNKTTGFDKITLPKALAVVARILKNVEKFGTCWILAKI